MRRSLTDVQPALDSEGGKLDAFVNQLKNNAAVAMRTLQAKQGPITTGVAIIVFSSYSSRGSNAQKSHNTASYTC